MNRTETQWRDIFISLGVVPVTADVWAPIFEGVIGPDTFSLGDAELDDFLANILHESSRLEKLEEGLTYRTPGRLMAVWPSRFPDRESERGYLNNPEALANKVYGGRMGNVDPGDGWKFRGGGLIMVTGSDNHAALQRATGLPVFDQPSLLRRPTEESLKVAIAWWEKNVPDAFMGNVPRTRKAVNGGDIGLDDVQRLTNLAGNVL